MKKIVKVTVAIFMLIALTVNAYAASTITKDGYCGKVDSTIYATSQYSRTFKTRTTTLKAIDIDNINTGIALAETSSGITLEDWLIKGYSTREVIAESHLSYSSPINAVTVYARIVHIIITYVNSISSQIDSLTGKYNKAEQQ